MDLWVRIPFASNFADILQAVTIKAYGILSSVFIYDIDAVIAYRAACLAVSIETVTLCLCIDA